MNFSIILAFQSEFEFDRINFLRNLSPNDFLFRPVNQSSGIAGQQVVRGFEDVIEQMTLDENYSSFGCINSV